MNDNILELPIGVVGRIDAGRLLREVQILDQFLDQAAVREPGTPMKLPKTSRLLDELLTINKLNALESPDRQRLLSFLTNVRSKAPMLHMSFSADPSPRFTQSLVSWLRKEIHPLVLIQVGLQPNIGAGCIVRTTNKSFDFSLKQYFAAQKDLLSRKLRGASDDELKEEIAEPSDQTNTVVKEAKYE